MSLLLLGAGCLGPGLLTDGTSVSVGTFTHGLLRHGARLPPSGPGYLVPPLWRARGANYTTDEMSLALQRVAWRVHREHPGGILGIADLSPPGGGDSQWHRSHENGRDADLIWYALDPQGRPVPPGDSMPRYDARLQARPPRPTPGVQFAPISPRRFDVVRNWALVRALLTEPAIEVQYLFCHRRLRQVLLEHARRIGEEDDLIERAEVLLHQPGDSLPHDDHLHVRIFCAPSDRPFGCRDQGPVRWWKKRYKYMPPAVPLAPSERVLARLLMSRYLRPADRLR
ncbi:MAG: penicillin-insensitive murein endopeptidase [Myxococcales bacterium]|nr:penicillin-insensitive murein endopeptidase [Myxococcota bacterium]MDW8283607.1 penicillin-insensitive murein endopeptidase [Myxococcales bacterium]